MSATNPIVIFESDKEKLFSVSFAEFSKDVEVSIYNWEGTSVFRSEFSTVGMNTKTFDASQLPNGKYIFIIADDTKEKATPFVITNGEINFRSSLATMTYTPSIQQLGKTVHINALVNNESSVKVQISEDDKTIFSEKYMADTTFGKILDLSALPTGFYILRVQMNEKNYSKAIVIE